MDIPGAIDTRPQSIDNQSIVLNPADVIKRYSLENPEKIREYKQPQDRRSIHTTYTQGTEPQRIPLPPSVADEFNQKKGLENSKEPYQDKRDVHNAPTYDNPGFAEKRKDKDNFEQSKEPKELQHRNVDDDTGFWQIYVEEAEKFDKELIESWNKNLDSLLLFAALFSAINTAFIIESYKSLQPDATESTNSLLRLILTHRNDDAQFSEAQLENGPWGGPLSGAVRVNSMLFVSLSCSILASFGAILGKEMLTEYQTSGVLSTPPDQARKRQKKYDGLKQYRFQLLMQILPILLQLSLALFLMGIIDFLWQMSFEVASFIMVPVAVGFVAYVASLAIAVRREDSPFQTSLSKSLRRFFHAAKRFYQKSIISQPATFRNYIRRWASSGLGQNLGRVAILIYIGGLGIAGWFVAVREQLGVGVWISSHVGGLGMAGWFMDKWERSDTGLFMALYIGGLGVLGWFAAGWKFLVSALKLSGNDDPTRDAISSNCVVWLLENSQDTKVIHKALETLPLLPADVLLQCFESKPKTLNRYILMCNAALQRRPGDVEFRLDEDRMKEAIASGTAIFHVLKSRQVNHRGFHEDDILGADPELIISLIDSADDPQILAKIDFSLLTVLFCIFTQNGVSDWDYKFLRGLLERFLATISDKSMMTETTDASSSPQVTPHPDSFKPVTPSVTLLLDAGIFMVAQRERYRSELAVHLYGMELEAILTAIHKILGRHPISMTLSSHVALLVAMLQWFKRIDDNPTVEHNELQFNGIKLAQLRKAWFAVDKRANFFDNIVLAFSLVGTSDSENTINVYIDLLRFTEHFLPKIMDMSWKHYEWEKWWSKITQIIPGLLRLLHQINLRDRPEVGHSVVRIISRLLPDDWSSEDVEAELSTWESRPLEFISPYHPESGSNMVTLMSSVLSSSSTLDSSQQTRWCIAEVLTWVVIHSNLVGKLLPLIDSPKGIYQQSVTIPSFLMSVINSPGTSPELTKLCGYHYLLLVLMETRGFPLASKVQLEALAIALANTKAYFTTSLDNTLFQYSYLLLDKMTRSGELDSWPMSFHERGIAQWEEYEEHTPQKRVLQLVHYGWHQRSDGITEIVSGEALMLLWKKLWDKNNNLTDSEYMFREDILLTVLGYFDSAIAFNWEVSCQILEDYLKKAIELERVGDVLRERVNNVTSLLRVANTDGWDSLILKLIGEKKGEEGQEVGQPTGDT